MSASEGRQEPIARIKAYRRTVGAVVTVERQGRAPRRYVVSLRRYHALREWTITGLARKCKTSGSWMRASMECCVWTGLKRLAVAAVAITLAACATCERHPVACTAAVAIVGASVALSVRHGGSSSQQAATCENNPAFPNGCHPIG